MTDRIILRSETQKTHAVARISAMRINPEQLTEIVFRKHVNSRSLKQNNLYWKWMAEIGDAIGYSKYGMHRTMMEEHLQPNLIDTLNGIREEYSTTGLNVKEMSVYLEKISITAGMYGVSLTFPDELRPESERAA